MEPFNSFAYQHPSSFIFIKIITKLFGFYRKSLFILILNYIKLVIFCFFSGAQNHFKFCPKQKLMFMMQNRLIFTTVHCHLTNVSGSSGVCIVYSELVTVRTMFLFLRIYKISSKFILTFTMWIICLN